MDLLKVLSFAMLVGLAALAIIFGVLCVIRFLIHIAREFRAAGRRLSMATFTDDFTRAVDDAFGPAWSEDSSQVTADQKATALLERSLTKGQKYSWRTHGYFYVKSQHGNIYKLGNHRVEHCSPDDPALFCVALWDVPYADNLLALKLYLENDEDGFLKKANRIDGHERQGWQGWRSDLEMPPMPLGQQIQNAGPVTRAMLRRAGGQQDAMRMEMQALMLQQNAGIREQIEERQREAMAGPCPRPRQAS